MFLQNIQKNWMWKMEEKARKSKSSWPVQGEFEGRTVLSGYITSKMSVRNPKKNFQAGGWTNEPGFRREVGAENRL